MTATILRCVCGDTFFDVKKNNSCFLARQVLFFKSEKSKNIMIMLIFIIFLGSPVFLDVYDPDNSNSKQEDVQNTSNMLLALGCIGVVAFFLIGMFLLCLW